MDKVSNSLIELSSVAKIVLLTGKPKKYCLSQAALLLEIQGVGELKKDDAECSRRATVSAPLEFVLPVADPHSVWPESAGTSW